MKKTILFIFPIMFASILSFGQGDSARTINDKPGTPASLRKPTTLPSNQVPTLKSSGNAAQTINHQGTESNKVTHKSERYVIPYSSSPYKANKSTNQFNINNKPVENPDGSVSNKPPNVSNPIHK
ncbi:MAG: hypothetical protein ABI358_08870 [Ginsengibacter sp.]